MATVNTNVSRLSLAGGAVNSHRPACPPAPWPPAPLECIPSTPVSASSVASWNRPWEGRLLVGG